METGEHQEPTWQNNRHMSNERPGNFIGELRCCSALGTTVHISTEKTDAHGMGLF
jgi:hypothetical protein